MVGREQGERVLRQPHSGTCFANPYTQEGVPTVRLPDLDWEEVRRVLST